MILILREGINVFLRYKILTPRARKHQGGWGGGYGGTTAMWNVRSHTNGYGYIQRAELELETDFLLF
jgi:hypothetical protein